MARAIITIYISKCAQMNPQQLFKTTKFYSKCKKCDIEKTLGGGYHPLGSPKVKLNIINFRHRWCTYLAHWPSFEFCRFYLQTQTQFSRNRPEDRLCSSRLEIIFNNQDLVAQVLTKNFNSFDTDLRRTVSGSTCHGTKYLSLKSHI